ncbi:MAG: o-succinylbenzoate synthase [Elainella sp. Prado103]|nr:o-succinylbenzoate synthase [Elainella sp. Prado103]
MLKFEFRPYTRRFRSLLLTRHGAWSVRQGILLRLSDSLGNQSWGEIAPIESFGSESFREALRFCADWFQAGSGRLDAETIEQIPAHLPACRFGFESAWEQLHTSETEQPPPISWSMSLLLPTGGAALDSPLLFSAQPGNTLKWKIGVAPIEQELDWFTELISLLSPTTKLRLDANGGLTWQQASRWLQVCDGYGIEFLEQPLPPQQFEAMLKLSQRYQTPIALDESVTSVAQLQDCYQRGWRGVFVIKAPIAGSPGQLRNFCQTHPLDLVWSSVFETVIARQYVTNYLMPACPTTRAIGFGVDQWFQDGWDRLGAAELWRSALTPLSRLSPF